LLHHNAQAFVKKKSLNNQSPGASKILILSRNDGSFLSLRVLRFVLLGVGDPAADGTKAKMRTLRWASCVKNENPAAALRHKKNNNLITTAAGYEVIHSVSSDVMHRDEEEEEIDDHDK
jgi:hypothetical protein